MDVIRAKNRMVCDNSCLFTEFLEELSSVRLASINEVPPGHNTNPPVLIHCSEGGGRAGVTLSADLLLYTLDHNQVGFWSFLVCFFR